MKHILTILIMMLALGSYASEPSVTDSISSAEKVDTMALHAGKSWVNRILDYFNDSNKNKKVPPETLLPATTPSARLRAFALETHGTRRIRRSATTYAAPALSALFPDAL